jgi:2-polyprenyl-3-methyl-5-hydroxy-6-metoxy-1,4-benzoquinol methylase
MDSALQRVEKVWDSRAPEWNEWIGVDGDENRRSSTDKHVWELAGDVNGLDVLDAGCGTGYLSVKMAQKGTYILCTKFTAKR